MNDRDVARALEARLGADSVRRLTALRRRLWMRRAVRSGVLVLAAVLIALALVQLAVRAFPFEQAVWVRAGIVAAGLAIWIADVVRRRPSLVETARRADEELELRQRLATAGGLSDRASRLLLESRDSAVESDPRVHIDALKKRWLDRRRLELNRDLRQAEASGNRERSDEIRRELEAVKRERYPSAPSAVGTA